MSEPFEAAQEQMMRAKWLEDSKVLHGPFVPSGGSRFSSADKTLDTPTRTILPQVYLLCFAAKIANSAIHMHVGS